MGLDAFIKAKQTELTSNFYQGQRIKKSENI